MKILGPAVVATLLINVGLVLLAGGALLGYWAAFQFMQARASLRELDNILEARANRAQEVIDHSELAQA